MSTHEYGSVVRRFSWFVAIAVLAGWTTVAVAADPTPVKITYLYDTTEAVAGTHSSWGFAALVEALGRREGLPVYYPAGANPRADFIGALDRAGMKRIPVTEMTTILPRISVSHQMKGPMASERRLSSAGLERRCDQSDTCEF